MKKTNTKKTGPDTEGVRAEGPETAAPGQTAAVPDADSDPADGAEGSPVASGPAGEPEHGTETPDPAAGAEGSSRSSGPAGEPEHGTETSDPADETRISVRSLVEFILRSGDIDLRRGGAYADREAMQLGSRLHRKLQKAAGSGYRSEVPLSGLFPCDDFFLRVEGRADGIIDYTEEAGDGAAFLIDEIKGIMRPVDHVKEPVPVHLAQAKCYAYLYGRMLGWEDDLPGGADAAQSERIGGEPIAPASAAPNEGIGGEPVVPASAAPTEESGGEPITPASAMPTEESGGEPIAPASAGQSAADRLIRIRMSYGSLETEEIKYFYSEYRFSELKTWFEGVLDSYRKWAIFERDWKLIRNRSIRETTFPFPYRDGQKDLAAGVYRTIVHQRMLFIQAPTGSGKTLSTVFPAVKAMGGGRGDRLFYLTARTITRVAAMEAFDQLRGTGLRLKSVVLTAKERICPMGTPVCDPDHCPYAKGHFDRVNDAVYELITGEDAFDRTRLLAAADEYRVCPFELSLDVSSWMDAVICDYNYVFQPRAKLRRFFGEGVKGDYLFLVDEAHNLVDRGRDMYSAALIKEDFLRVSKEVKHEDGRLAKALNRCNRQMLAMKRSLAEEGDGASWRPVPSAGIFPLALASLAGAMEDFFDDHPESPAADSVRDLYFSVLTFLDVNDHLDDHYIIYQEVLHDGSFMLRQFCVDPSRRLQECFDRARSSILFSATLLPVDYYMSHLSTRDDNYAMYAKTCFDSGRLQVLIGRDISSRYTRRDSAFYERTAQYIRTITQGKTGNYMVFFSSYRMLEETEDRLRPILPSGCELLCQKSGMREEEREEFLDAFSRPGTGSLIGMCVMGSIFGEGIDLKGDRLIGAIIVGAGLPQVCTQQEILRGYYTDRGDDGFRSAYLCPGMNKVLQAAGRVIRTEEDTGLVALLDDRFADPVCRAMFPREWEGIRFCTLRDVRTHVERFWGERLPPA